MGMSSRRTSNAGRRAFLFGQGVSALNQTIRIGDPNQPGTNADYMCPLCLEFFDAESLSQDSDDPLSLEDIPPKAVGAKSTILTCRRCNNAAGAGPNGPDFHRARHNAVQAVIAGKPGASASGRLADANVKVSVGRQREMFIWLDERHNHPTAYERVVGQFDAPTDGHPSHLPLVLPKTYDDRLVQISYLRTAYLAAFAVYGYRYILQPSIKPVREQIQNPTKVVLEQLPPLLNGLDLPGELFSVGRVMAPADFTAVYVRTGGTVSYLPAPGQEPDWYDHAHAQLSRSAGTQVNLLAHSWPKNPTYFEDGREVPADCVWQPLEP